MNQLNTFHYKKNKMFCENVPIEEIAHEFSTPLYVYSKSEIERSYQELFNSIKEISKTICYAVKANSNLSILKYLKELGSGFDIVSGGELFRLEKINAPANKIIFSGVGKTKKEIEYAINYLHQGIKTINVESLEELELINVVGKEYNKKISVSLRFNPDIDANTHPYISTGLKNNKFGIEKAKVLEVFKNTAKYSYASFDGLSIHIGSQILDMNPMEQAFKSLISLAKECENLSHSPLEHLDIGGGVGIPYKDNDHQAPVKQYGELVKKYFSNTSYEILLEPGRLIVGNAGALVSKVLFIKKGENQKFIVIDAAMNDLIRPGLYNSYHKISPSNFYSNSTEPFDIVGPVCESTDCFAKDRLMSVEIKPNDILVIHSSGAYGQAMSSNFNSRPKIAEVLVYKNDRELIRKRDSLEDLISNEIID